MPRVTHFEIYVDDPERSTKFYSDVFGWKIEKWEGPFDYWLITTGPKDQPGINGGIAKRDKPEQSTINTIDVPSVDDYIAKITKAGGKVIMPKMAIPGVGYMAHCADTEGNTIGIMQEDLTVK